MSDEDAINHLSLNYTGPVKAVLINYDDHAYAKIHFDEKTLTNLEDNLYRVEDELQRAQIWS